MKKSLLLAALIVAVVSVVMNPITAIGNHEPADKASASASEMDTVGDEAEPVLAETMRVSSTSDLILQTTAECSILTSVLTDTDGESSGAFGQVKMWIEIDGQHVPVATDDEDNGEVVFCNRAYARLITDQEGDGDIDSEDDFIRTRTANAFNWMAFDVGKNYDADGDNVVEIVLWADYAKEPDECPTREADNSLEPYGQSCADAFVGNRTLIAEVTHASNHEQPDSGIEE